MNTSNPKIILMWTIACFMKMKVGFTMGKILNHRLRVVWWLSKNNKKRTQFFLNQRTYFWSPIFPSRLVQISEFGTTFLMLFNIIDALSTIMCWGKGANIGVRNKYFSNPYESIFVKINIKRSSKYSFPNNLLLTCNSKDLS